jgi:hypothetical protein
VTGYFSVSFIAVGPKYVGLSVWWHCDVTAYRANKTRACCNKVNNKVFDFNTTNVVGSHRQRKPKTTSKYLFCLQSYRLLPRNGEGDDDGTLERLVMKQAISKCYKVMTYPTLSYVCVCIYIYIYI